MERMWRTWKTSQSLSECVWEKEGQTLRHRYTQKLILSNVWDLAFTQGLRQWLQFNRGWCLYEHRIPAQGSYHEQQDSSFINKCFHTWEKNDLDNLSVFFQAGQGHYQIVCLQNKIQEGCCKPIPVKRYVIFIIWVVILQHYPNVSQLVSLFTPQEQVS